LPLFVVAALVLSLSTAGSASAAFGYLDQFGTQGNGDGEFENPFGIDVDGNDNVYVSDCQLDRIQKFDSNGAFITKWGASGTGNSQFSCPYQVTYNPVTNTILVADWGNNRVKIFSLSGTFLGSVGSGAGGTADGDLNGPSGVAVDSIGNYYVAEETNDRVSKFSPAGTFITKWGSTGTADGQFDEPRGVEIGPDGDVWVADYQNARVQIFSPTGSFVEAFGSSGTDPGQFGSVTDVAFGRDGLVFAPDEGGNRLNIYDLMGVSTFGSSGTGDGQFNTPTYATTDSSSCNLYVADYSNSRVQKLGDPACALPPPGNGGSGGGSAVVVDKVRPVFSSVSLSNPVFRVDPAGAVIAKARKGTRFRFRLSEAAQVTFRIDRRLAGRRVGGKCRKPTARNRRKRRCTRHRHVKTFSRAGKAGKNSLRFSGRYRSRGKVRSLKPGSYRLTIRASDSASNRSGAVTRRFRVVKN
jgi:streptogramin lyase